MKLNIGSGENYREGWTNVDGRPDVKADIYDNVSHLDDRFPLQADEIVANDILEHIPYSETNKDQWKTVLASWVRCLKPGGTIRIQVPCMDSIFVLYMNDKIDEDLSNRVLYGENTSWFDRHYQLFARARLLKAMEDCGLVIESVEYLHICLIVIGRKT